MRFFTGFPFPAKRVIGGVLTGFNWILTRAGKKLTASRASRAKALQGDELCQLMGAIYRGIGMPNENFSARKEIILNTLRRGLCSSCGKLPNPHRDPYSQFSVKRGHAVVREAVCAQILSVILPH